MELKIQEKIKELKKHLKFVKSRGYFGAAEYTEAQIEILEELQRT